MKVAVVIATKGRPEILSMTLDSLRRQTVVPSQIIVVATTRTDVPECISDCEVIFGSAGLTIQRNIGIHALHKATEIVVFLDDDVELAYDYFAGIIEFFGMHPQIVGGMGTMIRDGAVVGSISREEARALTLSYRASSDKTISDLYGCNLSVRYDILYKERFDERLALYGWMEDRDFSNRIRRYGDLSQIGKAGIVHLGARSGRVSNRRLGFAQIVNVLYLYNKGTLSFKETAKSLKPIVVNLLKLFDIERRERFIGNLLGLESCIRYGAEPERIRDLR